MKQNPYSTALSAIGMITVALSGVLYLFGLSQQNSGALDGGLVWFAHSATLFPLGVIGIIAWLLLDGIRWQQPAARPSLTESSHPTS